MVRRRVPSHREHCERCLLAAPGWSAASYSRWHVLVAPSGQVLGLVCPGCAANPQLSLELLEAP